MPAIVYDMQGDYFIIFPKRGRPFSTKNKEVAEQFRKKFLEKAVNVDVVEKGDLKIFLYDMTLEELEEVWMDEYGTPLS